MRVPIAASTTINWIVYSIVPGCESERKTLKIIATHNIDVQCTTEPALLGL